MEININDLAKKRLKRRREFCISSNEIPYDKIIIHKHSRDKIYNSNKLIEKLNDLVDIQKKINNIEGFARYNFYLSRVEQKLMLISDRQGPNLKLLCQYYNCMNGKMKYQTFLLIIYKIFDIIHSLHKENLIHLDIKPSNICICNFSEIKKGNIIKFIDHETIGNNNRIKLYDIGTERYKSINMSKISGTKDLESCHCFNFSDDFESFFYTIIYIFFGDLPWNLYDTKDEIYDKKKKFKKFALQNNEFPKIFKQILEIIENSYQIDKYNQCIYDNIKIIIANSLQKIVDRDVVDLDKSIKFLFEWDIECKKNSQQFKNLYNGLNISYDNYITELNDFEKILQLQK